MPSERQNSLAEMKVKKAKEEGRRQGCSEEVGLREEDREKEAGM